MKVQSPDIMIIGLAGATLALSIALFPHRKDLALSDLRDHKLVEATAMFNSALQNGDQSASVVSGLVQAALEEGDIDHAIALVENYLAKNPKDLSAHRMIVDLYKQAQKPDDYLAALVTLQSMEPTKDREEELDSIYFMRGDVVNRTKVLDELIAHYKADFDDYTALARIHAAQHDFPGALKVLDQMVKAYPAARDVQMETFRIILMFEIGQTQAAVAEAAAFIAAGADDGTILDFSQIVTRRAGSSQGANLLKPRAEAANAPPALVTAYIQLLADAGQRQAAFARLDQYAVTHELDADKLDLYLNLAAANNAWPKIMARLDAKNWKVLSSDTLLSTITAASQAGQTALIQDALKRIGPEELQARPLLAAQLSMAAGDKVAAKLWVDRAEAASAKKPGLSPSDELALTRIELDLGLDASALGHFTALTRGTPPEDVVIAMADLYIKLGRAKQGETQFAALRKPGISPSIDFAWAMMASAAGDGGAALEWFRYAADSLPEERVQALYWPAHDHGAGDMALAVAQKLVALHSTPETQSMLGDALMMQHRYAEALPILRGFRNTPDGDARFGAALVEAYAHGIGNRAEVAAWWGARLAQAKDEAAREEAIYALLAIKDYAPVLPALVSLAGQAPQKWLGVYIESANAAGKKTETITFLRNQATRDGAPPADRILFTQALIDQGGGAFSLPAIKWLAEHVGGDWIAAYDAELTKESKRDELKAFLAKQAARPDLKAQNRRELAFRLLDLGDKANALRLFQQLSASEPPTGPDVDQVLFLAGPRPGDDVLDWLEQSGRHAQGDDRAGWMSRLTRAGAPRRALALADSATASSSNVEVARAEALVALNDRPALAALLDRAIAGTHDPSLLRQLGEIATQSSELTRAYHAYAAWIAVAPNDPAAQRAAGLAAFDARNFTDAEKYLTQYHSMGTRDWQTELFMGEILLERKNNPGAVTWFNKALDDNNAIPHPGFQERSSHAHLLFRTGHTAEADQAYATLVKERPADKDLRADYAEMLLEMGAPARARALAGNS